MAEDLKPKRRARRNWNEMQAQSYSDGQRDALAERAWLEDKAWADAVMMLVHYTDAAAITHLVGHDRAVKGLEQAWKDARAMAATRSAEDIAALARRAPAPAPVKAEGELVSLDLLGELDGVISDLESSGWVRAPGCIATLKRVASALPEPAGEPLQARVQPWMTACFGPEIAADRLERNDRFIEEALELVQASGYAKERALQLVEYVYGRPQGDINQEVGGVMITLAAHCLAHGVDMHEAGETELARIWTKVEQIREKQKTKPKGSALPIPVKADTAAEGVTKGDIAWLESAKVAGHCGEGMVEVQERSAHNRRIDRLLAAITRPAALPPTEGGV